METFLTQLKNLLQSLFDGDFYTPKSLLECSMAHAEMGCYDTTDLDFKSAEDKFSVLKDFFSDHGFFVLGEGGQGVCFSNKKVVVKIGSRYALAAEAKALLSLKGVLSPEIYAYRINFLMTAYIEGEHDFKLTEEFAFDLGKALKTLHLLGVIHGDLNSDNLKYNNREVTFIDFGSSVPANPESIKSELYNAKVFLSGFTSEKNPKLMSAFNEGYQL